MSQQLSDPYPKTRSNSLYELTPKIGAVEHSDAALEAALVWLRACLSVEKSSILLFDDFGAMRFKTWLNISLECRRALEGYSPWRPDTRDAQPVLVSDVRHDQDLARLAGVIEAESIRALAFFPIALEGKLVGSLMLCYQKPHDIEAEEELVAQNMASQVAFAIDRLSRSEEHQQPASIRRSEERYVDLIEAMGLAVYTTDASGHIALYNEAAVELWGRRPEVGKDLWCGSWRIYQPDNGQEMPLEECPMAVTLKEDRPVRDVEIVVERPDGSRANILPYPTPLHDAAGNLVGAVNVLLDITDLKQGEQAALYLAAIVESSEDAIVSKDLNGIITSWNRGAEKIFGYSAAEAVGQSIRLIIPQEHQHEEDQVLARLRRGGRIENFETIRRRKDGTELHVSLTVSPVKDRRGVTIGASKIARDISLRKAAEEAMRETIAIKDQFLGLVSHELRTPITTIHGNGLLLQRRNEHLASEDRMQAFTDIVSQSSRLLSIIENLLLITRMEAGQLELEPLSLEPIVKEVIADLQRQSPERKILFAADPEVPVANGQQTLISLVLRNLLGNADKYSPPEATIEVKLRNQSGLPQISVIDRGIGMDEAELEEIFTPFFRTQRARATAKGMGLGLAVCRRIVEVHGGTIKVSSEPNKGSEFVFSLQAARGADPDPRQLDAAGAG